MDDETLLFLREIANALDAIVVALQMEAPPGDANYGMTEAVRRVNRFRQHLEEIAPGVRLPSERR
ncbi:MAG: hypothetical protein WEC33_03070 [Dehalococcoidia bacterium]